MWKLSMQALTVGKVRPGPCPLCMWSQSQVLEITGPEKKGGIICLRYPPVQTYLYPPPHSWPRGGHCCNKSKSQGKPCYAMFYVWPGSQAHYLQRHWHTVMRQSPCFRPAKHFYAFFSAHPVVIFSSPPPLHHHQQASPGWLGLAGTTVSPCLCWENRHTSDHMDNNIETNVKSGIL